MTTENVMFKLQLVDGVFTPSEAKDVINSLIKVKINFHKVNRMSEYVSNNDCGNNIDDSRVAQLERQKDHLATVYQEAKLAGKEVRINGVLKVEIID